MFIDSIISLSQSLGVSALLSLVIGVSLESIQKSIQKVEIKKISVGLLEESCSFVKTKCLLSCQPFLGRWGLRADWF